MSLPPSPFLPLAHSLPPSLLPAPNIYTENEQIAKYEIMDGAPVRGQCTGSPTHRPCTLPPPLPFPGESIPIRLFLSGYDLTPTMRDINKKFSVRYYLNLVLVDEEERRYFKQQVCLSSPPQPCAHLHALLLHTLLLPYGTL